MSLESCPKCGYAVSIAGKQCRHCATSPPGMPLSIAFDGKLILRVTLAALWFGVVAYLIRIIPDNNVPELIPPTPYSIPASRIKGSAAFTKTGEEVRDQQPAGLNLAVSLPEPIKVPHPATSYVSPSP
jgi:hypothetical protein